ncbi:MAG: AgmX/PglI C-terminal domain-containing protein [Polyangiales bacterium]
MNVQSYSRAKPGEMTIAMRALPRANGPRVLRIGKVLGGRVIEERIIKERATVTIGASHDCTFVVSGVGDSLRLFEIVAGEYVLNLDGAMTGRAAVKTGLIELAGQRRVTLDEGARGKVVIGDTTFLFQFVDKAPVQPKAQLPLAISGASRVDWGFAVIAAFSFLLHFGFAGAVNSDWFDPTIDDGAETASLIQEAKDRPSPPVVEEQKSDDPSPDKNVEKTVDKSPTPDKSAPGPKNAPGPHKSSSADPVALTQQLEQLELKAIASIGTGGPAQSSLLKPGATAVDGNLDKVAEKSTGVSTDGSLKVPGAAVGPLGPGATGKDGLSGGFNVTKSTPSTVVADKSDQVKTPTTIGTPPTQGNGNAKDADSVIARNRWRFKSCYDKALALDPNAGGTVRVTVRVGDDGGVTSASASGDAPAGLTECVRVAFTAMKFSSPDNGSAQFTAPVVLSTAKK